MALGRPVTFGGGFAQGLLGGLQTGNEIINRNQRTELFAQQTRQEMAQARAEQLAGLIKQIEPQLRMTPAGSPQRRTLVEGAIAPAVQKLIATDGQFLGLDDSTGSALVDALINALSMEEEAIAGAQAEAAGAQSIGGLTTSQKAAADVGTAQQRIKLQREAAERAENTRRIVVEGDSPLNQAFNLNIPKGQAVLADVVYENGQPVSASIANEFSVTQPEPPKRTIIISGDDPRNKQFGLGIPEDGSAFVEITENRETGEQVYNVTKRFGAGVEFKMGDLGRRERISQLIDLADNIQTRKEGAIRVNRLANRVISSVGDDATPIGIVGSLARLGNTVSEQAQAIARATGVDFDVGRFNFDAFPDTAIQAAQVRSNLLSLAFAIATAEEGSRLSDQDIQRALTRIGAGTGSPTQMRASMGEVIADVNQNIDDTIAINAKLFEQHELGVPSTLSEDLQALGIEPLQRTEIEELPEGIPEGSNLIGQSPAGNDIYMAPNGDQYEVVP